MPSTPTQYPVANAATLDHEAHDSQCSLPSPAPASCSPQLLATVSHELRVPLNGVHGMATLLMGTSLTAEQRRYVATIQSSVEALIGLANDVLDWTSLETGKLTFESTLFSLRTLVDDVNDVCAEAAHRKRIEIVALFDDDLPEQVIGDPFRVRQALLNLVSNAVKFTNRGLVVVRVEVTAPADGTSLIRFEVSDTGPGIAADALARLFQPYVSADHVLARKLGGTGLGLSICRDLATRMGGTTGVTSTVGAGSTFFFTANLPSVAKATAASPSSSRRPHRVLIIDAMPELRDRAKQSFNHAGAEAVGVSNLAEADQAFQKADSDARPYDLVIVAHPEGVLDIPIRLLLPIVPPTVPFVRVCRTTDAEQSQARLATLGYSAVLMKPVRDEAVYALMQGLGEHSRTHSARAGSSRTAQAQRILIVDDDPASVTVAARFVERLGYEVDVITEGRRVVQMLERESYAAVCLDINLTDVNGCDVARQWRAQEPATLHTPIIAMTAHTTVEDRERFLAAGLDDHLAKPLRLDALRTTLDRWIPRPQPAPSLSQ